jgi:hypothetical protein
MNNLDAIAPELREHSQTIWQRGDAWGLESSAYEQGRYAYSLGKIDDRHYSRVLEIGCGSGCFTALLGRSPDLVLAMDIQDPRYLAGKGHTKYHNQAL